MDRCDVAIIGAGVTGAATAYVLARYTTVKSIVVLEKYDAVAQVNSHKDNNSQTLHFGDIETNYTVDKAKQVKEAAMMTARYLDAHAGEKLHVKRQKMVLAVGADEVATLEERYREFKTLFPHLRRVERKELAELEPLVVKGRSTDEQLLALASSEGYTVDFGKLAKSLLDHAQHEQGKQVSVHLGSRVKSIVRKGNGFDITSGSYTLHAAAVLVAAGPESLSFAYSMGLGKNLILLPVAGSFFRSSKKVNGKVYMMQLKKLPFAAIHADPDVHNPEETRYGPAAKVLPMLERHNYKSFFGFLRLFELRWDAIVSIVNILSDTVYVKYLAKQVLYSLPFLGRYVFLQEARKIIPTLQYSEIRYGKRLGGIRPQIVDTTTRTMSFGSAKVLGDGILFDITPSPGASVCIKNAVDNTKKILESLGERYLFDSKKFNKELVD